MKKIAAVIVGLVLVFLAGSPALAVKKYYKTYEVVEITEQNFVLQKGDGEKVEIERARRPDLRIGDKVRYDKHRNRLGGDVAEKTDDE